MFLMFTLLQTKVDKLLESNQTPLQMFSMLSYQRVTAQITQLHQNSYSLVTQVGFDSQQIREDTDIIFFAGKGNYMHRYG